jgi:16S rRNA (cytidine1402-2'-O)-methyltransferase
MNFGKLFLIPNQLGDFNDQNIIKSHISIINSINFFIFENEKPGRAFIKNISPEKKQSELKISLLNKHTSALELNEILNPCLNGFDIGLISDAGCPGIADPGAEAVKLAHNKGIKVIPLIGPSSILMALMSSGMNGQNFKFNGYLPIDVNKRKNMIKNLEKNSYTTTQIFMETPYRNGKLFSDLINTLKPTTQLCIARDITLNSEFIKTFTVKSWKLNKPKLDKRPTIFLIQSI